MELCCDSASLVIIFTGGVFVDNVYENNIGVYFEEGLIRRNVSKKGNNRAMYLDWSHLISNIDINFFLQIITVVFAAGIIGLERQLNKKPAGIRTSILIGLGSMLFVKYSIVASSDVGAVNADPARVMGQVVSGIGFLGAGTIMNRQGLVAGLTTASTIWVQAAIGSIVALGYYFDALIFSFVTLFVLQGVSKIEVWLRLSKIKGNRIRIREGVARLPLNEDEFDV